MDNGAALDEARRRWGDHGSISVADEFANARLLVGELMPGPRFIVRGRGSSWEAAFADADAREQGASRRRSAAAVPRRQTVLESLDAFDALDPDV